MQNSENPMEKVAKYARWGEWAATIAIGLYCLFLCLFVGAIALGLPFPTDDIIAELHLEDAATTLTVMQALVGVICLFFAEVLGLLMLITARKLFKGFRRNGVITMQAAADLRRIGLFILALAPMTILFEAIGNFILTLWITGDRISISLGFEDTDVYAIVIGLVITAVSQIMLEAVRISDENRAFV